MELSDRINHLQLRAKEFKKQNEGTAVTEKVNLNKDYDVLFSQDDLINVDEMDFSNDETWLCGNSGKSTTKDLHKWLYDDISTPKQTDFYPNRLSFLRETSEPRKMIDTRTFTRPKKKNSRPSIEHYNEEMYDPKQTNNTEDVLSQEIQNFMSSSRCTDPLSTSIISNDSESKLNHNKPLHFDLNQPSSMSIFDNILMNASSDIDSFQNMSPPSLVNSMCSSTFTNLMENSYIKNDPILREIRDADYSGEILIQDSEPPLYQSFTESCSSLNSDSAENFLRKTLPTLNGTFNLQSQLNTTYNSDSETNSTLTKKEDLNATIIIDQQSSDTFTKNDSCKDVNYSNNLNNSYIIEGNLNNTFKRNLTKDISYDMSSSNNSDIQCDSGGTVLNGTYRKPLNDQTLDGVCEIDKSFSKESNNSSLTDVYFNSAMSGSTDSLDHMSSLSNSSRGSNRMLNMAEVDAIVEEQERSLQVMSTPKPAKSMTKLFEGQCLSPIVRHKEHVSDSDLSSTDDYLTVRSTLSKGSVGHSEKNLKVLDRNVKSLSNLKHNPELKFKPHNIHTISRPMTNVKPLMGSYSNLRVSDANNVRGSYTNLKTVGTTLKGSYTNLKPVGLNLPVITSKPNSAPVSVRKPDLNETHAITNVQNDEIFKVPHVPPAQVKPSSAPVNSVKPQVRGSGLPRPIGTGIPRPVSKIPGPRMLRPPSTRITSRVPNKGNEGYY